MKWALVYKPEIQHVYDLTLRIQKELEERDQKVLMADRFVKEPSAKAVQKLDADIVVTVGGDGTILLALEQTEKPVLGVNAGGVGFLTEVEPKYVTDAIDRVLSNQYEVEERMRLASWLGKDPLPDAINEVTVQTAKIAKLIKFRVSVDGEVVDTIRGDGVIVATATGSTGYSMSVGGPILHPSVKGAIIAPIAPFRLAARPFVIPSESVVEIVLTESKSTPGVPAKVVIDGQHGYNMPHNGAVTIKPSPRRSRLIRFHKGFFGRVRTRLTR